jgi:hypothetical protein
MAPKDLLRFFDRLRIKEDNRFEEISEQKIFTPKLGACVDTVFLEKKRIKRDKEKQARRYKVQLADGKRRRMVNRIRRWSRKLKSVNGPASHGR